MMATIDYRSEPLKLRGCSHLVIGLVNNMPDGALRATERQFCGLLGAASRNLATYLRWFSLPGIPRGPQALAYVRRCYEPINDLWSGPLDGLIVTGTEPRTPSLPDEPYWPALKQLIDEANRRAIPTIWSCLAAHAAVNHLDAIRRRPLRKKLSGVFECRKIGDHEILADAPSRWWVPHSRQNELPEEELIAKGYRIMSRSPEVGADVFVREGRSLFVFLQGHLEYEPDTLFREYRRDVRRFLAGERDNYPAMPSGYFDAHSTASLLAFRERATKLRNTEAFVQFPESPGNLTAKWQDLAVRLYSNWLSHTAQFHSRPQPLNSSLNCVIAASIERAD
jgi:homoserine O-succinyltransferase